jgi:hypothetical protein
VHQITRVREFLQLLNSKKATPRRYVSIGDPWIPESINVPPSALLQREIIQLFVSIELLVLGVGLNFVGPMFLRNRCSRIITEAVQMRVDGTMAVMKYTPSEWAFHRNMRTSICFDVLMRV